MMCTNILTHWTLLNHVLSLSFRWLQLCQLLEHGLRSWHVRRRVGTRTRENTVAMNIDISFVALACRDVAIVVAGKMESWSTDDGTY